MTARARPRSRPSAPASTSISQRIALLFPGQGSQHSGMGRQLAETSPAARATFAEADRALGFPISRLCLDGSDDELQNTVNTQPAILATSIASLANVRERLAEMGRQLRPSFMAGHSLGQFTAAVAANALDFGDGLRLVLERGRIMAEWARNRPGGLATILGPNDQEVRRLCLDASPEGLVGVAVVNGPGQTVISGEAGPLARAIEIARERGARALRLPISTPGHTPLMRDAAREFSRFIAALPFRDPDPPIVSNISARLLTTAEQVREELAGQITAAVQWARCVLAMEKQGTETFIELAPGRALSKLVRRITDDARVFGADDAALAALPELVLVSEPRPVAR